LPRRFAAFVRRLGDLGSASLDNGRLAADGGRQCRKPAGAKRIGVARLSA
jgi:hypothetical protein